MQWGHGGPHGPVGVRKRCPRVGESKKLLPPNHRKCVPDHMARGLRFHSIAPSPYLRGEQTTRLFPWTDAVGPRTASQRGASVLRKTNLRVEFTVWPDRKAQADLCPPPHAQPLLPRQLPPGPRVILD